MPKRKPEVTFKSGGVRASIWKNVAKNTQAAEPDEDPHEFHSITIERVFKRDGSDSWESSNSYLVRDLAKVLMVVQEAMRHLMVRTDRQGN